MLPGPPSCSSTSQEGSGHNNQSDISSVIITQSDSKLHEALRVSLVCPRDVVTAVVTTGPRWQGCSAHWPRPHLEPPWPEVRGQAREQRGREPPQSLERSGSRGELWESPGGYSSDWSWSRDTRLVYPIISSEWHRQFNLGEIRIDKT